MLKRSLHRSQGMSTPEAEAVDERLAIFEDEADINDWIEVMCGHGAAGLLPHVQSR